MKNPGRLIIFDGACGLCHAWVRFVIRYDKRRVFKFTSMQSDIGQRILKQFNQPTVSLETMLYIENGAVFEKSRAFLQVVRCLPFPVSLLFGFYFLPRPFRDFVYDRIARNRYKLFGSRDECTLTGGALRDRFI